MHQKVRARKFFKKFFCIFLPICVLCALAWGGYSLFSHHFLFLDSELYKRDITRLDLSDRSVEQLDRIAELTALELLDLQGTGLTAGEYEKLQAALPSCTILWEPCFQGQFYSLDTRSLTVTTLTEADVIYLDYFPDLTAVDALECRDYDAILSLIQHRPDCQVSYQVHIGQEAYLKDATFITVTDEDVQELETMLPYLPSVTSVLFTGQSEGLHVIHGLSEKFPQITFDYQVDFHGQTLASTITEADFSGLPLTQAREIEDILPYLPNLTYVDVSDCTIPHEQMAALSQRWPQIQFVWTVNLAGVDIRTDVTTFDLSGKYVGDAALVDSVLPYFPNLTEVILCDCGIGNEEMDALNRKYEDIKIVWTVNLGPNLRVRSDIDALMPTKYNVWLQDAEAYNLRYCTELVALDLGHMDIYNIDFAAYMPHLKYLIVADSPISSLEPLRGLQELVYLEAFLTRVTDYSPLVDCPALESLNISWTYGSYEPLTKMTNLKRLWWGGTAHAYYAVQQLTECLPDAQLVLYDGNSTGSGWRKQPHYYKMRDMLGMYYME